MAIEITDEMRRAVLEELCAEIGHSPSIDNLFFGENGKTTIKGKNDRMPFIQCLRCRKVWIVAIEEPAANYDEAEQNVVSAMTPESAPRREIEARRQRRRNNTKGA